MILIVCHIHAINTAAPASSAKIWVDTHDPAEAENRATQKLREEGFAMQQIIEITATGKDDYFPPCTSLDAFERAEREGICILYT